MLRCNGCALGPFTRICRDIKAQQQHLGQCRGSEMSVGRGQAGRQACGEGGGEAQWRCAVLCCARPACWKAASSGTDAVPVPTDQGWRGGCGWGAITVITSSFLPPWFIYLFILIHYLVFGHS